MDFDRGRSIVGRKVFLKKSARICAYGRRRTAASIGAWGNSTSNCPMRSAYAQIVRPAAMPSAMLSTPQMPLRTSPQANRPGMT